MRKQASTTAEAKAKAKAEASIVATAAALMAEADDVTRFHLVAAATVGTVAEHLAAASDAATFVAKAEADAFRATAAARQAIGARLYRAFVARVTEADANAEVKTAAEVTFTTLMAAVVVGATEESWKTMTSRPIARGWSTLKEDYATFVHTTGDAWMDAYLVSVGENTPTVRGYLAFAKDAEAEANAAEERGETSQARSARTAKARREANVAEAERQAKAKADAETARVTKAEEAKTKATNEATALVANVLARPSANVVPGVEITNAVVAALSVDTLRAAAAVFTVWADHAEADAAAKAKATKATKTTAETVADGQAKAEEAVAKHDTAEEAEALGTKAEAEEAEALAEYQAFVAFKAMRAAATV